MKQCEEHRFGKWEFSHIDHDGGAVERHCCVECGASQVRLIEIVEPINTRPDYVVVKRRDLEHLERLTDKKIARVE